MINILQNTDEQPISKGASNGENTNPPLQNLENAGIHHHITTIEVPLDPRHTHAGITSVSLENGKIVVKYSHTIDRNKVVKNIDELDLSVRLYNFLKAHGLTDTNKIAQKNLFDLSKHAGFGQKCANELGQVLNEHNIISQKKFANGIIPDYMQLMDLLPSGLQNRAKILDSLKTGHDITTYGDYMNPDKNAEINPATRRAIDKVLERIQTY